MFYTFCISNSKDRILEIYNKLQNEQGYRVVYEEDNNWSLILKYQYDSDLNNNCFLEKNNKHYLIGEIYNVTELRVFLSSFDTKAICCSVIELLLLLNNNLGKEAWSFVEGNFSFLSIFDSGTIRIITDQLGQQRIYKVYSNNIYITSELKILSLTEKEAFDFYKINNFQKLKTLYGDSFIPIKNVQRIEPGSITIVNTISSINSFECQRFSKIGNCKNNKDNISSEDALVYLEKLLVNSIENCLQNSNNPLVTISGGLDSGIVSSIVNKKQKNIYTLSVGTNESNEFNEASIVSKFLKSNHNELLISNEEVIHSIFKAIFYNEIFDSLSAEIQAGLFSVYDNFSTKHDVVITGYGSDLIFGGILDCNMKQEDVNSTLWKQIYRTRWTGEFSLVGSAVHGLRVRHPFWNYRLISFFKDISPLHKINDGKIKFLLKSFAEKNKFLPKEIIHRKKIGIHQGSSINSIFSKILLIDRDDYISKDILAYDIYRDFLNLNISEKDLKDPMKLITKYRKRK